MADRIDRIEAILRAYKLHEPTCPVFPHDLRSRSPSSKVEPTLDVYYTVPDCTCWLATHSPSEGEKP